MDELVKAGRAVRYKKGEILIRPLDDPTYLCILNSGMVHSYVITKQGEKNIQLIYGPHEIFPLAWMASSSPLNIYYEAVVETEVVRVRLDVVKQMVATDLAISNSLLAQTIRQFILFKARVDNLEYKFARERIAYRLLLLGHRFGITQDGVVTMPKFSQEEIGSTTNVSRESVSRELKRFEHLGYIEHRAKQIRILNAKALRIEISDDDSTQFIYEIL